MEALRLEVMRDLLSIKGMSADMLRAVLCHPNIAIVDREAELPEVPKWTFANIGGFKGVEGLIALIRQNMLKEGWIKEVKQ